MSAIARALRETPQPWLLLPVTVVVALMSTLPGALVTGSGRSAWYIGAPLLTVHAAFAVRLYLIPPASG